MAVHEEEPSKRIAELEAQVRRLTQEVESLKQTENVDTPAGSDTTSSLQEIRAELVQPEEMLALYSPRGGNVESRIGVEWLSRIAAVLLMTALVGAVAQTVGAEDLLRYQKLGLVYLISIAGLVYGLVASASQNALAKTILGSALAGFYYATYAAFFVEDVRVIDNTAVALPALLAVLVGIGVITAWRRSQTVAGIALFLVYYTVMASAAGQMRAEAIAYAFGTGIVIAALALYFMAAYRWVLFSWLSAAAIYGTHIYYFGDKPFGLAVSDTTYFWTTTGFLTLVYLLMSIGFILETRSHGGMRRSAVALAVANSSLYAMLVWRYVDMYFPDYDWVFGLAFAVALAALALYAETSGPNTNLLYQAFLAKCVIVFSLALTAYFPTETLYIAFAAQCLALAVLYNLTGVVALKVLNLGLLLITFAGALTAFQFPGGVDLEFVIVPSSWFSGVGVAFLFMICAWYYEAVCEQRRPEHRVVSGHWFLADSVFDLPTRSVSMLHGAGAALVLLMVMILELRDDTTLPFGLALASVCMAAIGFLLRTPQIEAAGITLIVGSHVTYHFLLWDKQIVLLADQRYVALTVLISLYTYLGAFLWERYLFRERRGPVWEHHLIAAIPFIMATYMMAAFIDRQLGILNGPMAVAALGVALFVAGRVSSYSGIKASAVFSTVLAVALFVYRRYQIDPGYADASTLLAYAAGLIAVSVFAERIIHRDVLQQTPTGTTAAARFLLAACATGLGLMMIDLRTDAEIRTVVWVVYGMTVMGVGFALRERMYRWCALFVIAAATGRAFIYPDPWPAQTFALIGAIVFIVSWLYSIARGTPGAAGRQQDSPANE